MSRDFGMTIIEAAQSVGFKTELPPATTPRSMHANELSSQIESGTYELPDMLRPAIGRTLKAAAVLSITAAISVGAYGAYKLFTYDSDRSIPTECDLSDYTVSSGGVPVSRTPADIYAGLLEC